MVWFSKTNFLWVTLAIYGHSNHVWYTQHDVLTL
jgi:hypothetical protein